MAAAAAAMVMLGACTTKECQKGDNCAKFDQDQVYTGIIPAADCDGVRMTVHLDFDDNAKDGDYKMVEIYFNNDTTSVSGVTDVKTFTSEGDFTVGQQGGKKYYKLVQDAKDSMAGSADVTYFLVDSDSTITMTNSTLDVPTTPGMNYTLKLAK